MSLFFVVANIAPVKEGEKWAWSDATSVKSKEALVYKEFSEEIPSRGEGL